MARIYDKYREIDIEVGEGQAKAMAKYKPDRYVLPSEVENTDKPDQSKEGVNATASAIKLAQEHGIDLSSWGKKRIIKKDVQNFINEQG